MLRRRRDISLTLALCLSLAAHAWIIQAAAERFVRQFSLPVLAAAVRDPAADVIGPEEEPPATVQPIIVQRPTPPAVRLGDSTGGGEAIASIDGEAPQQAPLADQEQADTSLDPEGDGTPPAAPPAFPDAAQAQAALTLPGASESTPASAAAGERSQERAEASDVDTEARKQDVNLPGPPAAPPKPAPAAEAGGEPAPSARPSPQQSPVAAQRPPDARTEEAGRGEGDPAPQTDTRVDGFSTRPSVEFRRGKTVAQLGRKHRIISPRLEMAAHADMLQLRPPITAVLRLYISAEGNVTKVDVIKSSGSINIDQPLKQLAYRWWFEPAKDSAGKPVAEVLDFPCTWR